MASMIADRISLDRLCMAECHTSLSLRVAARDMLGQMGSLQFAIASDLLRVLSRVPNHLNIEEAHTVSMDVCEYLESRMMFGSRASMFVRDRMHTEDDGSTDTNRSSLVETIANELRSHSV